MSFGSNSNYFLCNNGVVLDGVTVVIDITEDMVCALASNGHTPQNPAQFSFQLNAYSTLTGDACWQQFVFYVANNASGPGAVLAAMVETWPSAAFAASGGFKGDLINSTAKSNTSVNLPGQMLPAGYKLTITLGNDDNYNINSATFAVLDNNSNQVMNETVLLTSLTTDNTGGGAVTTPDLSPIVAFQLNIVGAWNATALFLKGAGTITYYAASPLTAVTSHPPYAGATNWRTNETANTVYGPIPPGELMGQIQAFSSITYVVGGFLAASQRYGVSNQTDLFAIGNTGQLGVFSVQAAGNWATQPPIGSESFPPAGALFALPGSPLAVSQQFGATNQTDVFVVGINGHLNVFSSSNGGAWAGPLQISGSGFSAPPFTWVAASQRFGANNQTDVYVVDNEGQLNVFSVIGPGTWSGPVKIGAAGFAMPGAGVAASQQYGIANQTDVFVVDKTGQLNVFWIDGAGSAWRGPLAIGGSGFSAPSGAPLAVSQQFGVPDQTDVFVVDNAGQLNVFYAVKASSWGRVKIGPANTAQPGAQVAVSQRFGVTGETDVYVVNTQGALTMFSVQNAGAWSAPQTILKPGQGGFNVGAITCVAASQQFGAVNQTDLFVLNGTAPSLSSGLGWPSVLWATGAGSWASPQTLVFQV
jgi:hypothetical protein